MNDRIEFDVFPNETYLVDSKLLVPESNQTGLQISVLPVDATIDIVFTYYPGDTFVFFRGSDGVHIPIGIDPLSIGDSVKFEFEFCCDESTGSFYYYNMDGIKTHFHTFVDPSFETNVYKCVVLYNEDEKDVTLSNEPCGDSSNDSFNGSSSGTSSSDGSSNDLSNGSSSGTSSSNDSSNGSPSDDTSSVTSGTFSDSKDNFPIGSANNKGPLSTGAIVGIALGATALVALVAGIIIFVVYRNKRSKMKLK